MKDETKNILLGLGKTCLTALVGAVTSLLTLLFNGGL